MKRRDLLKSFLAAPFVGLFKGKKSKADYYPRAKDCFGQNGTLCPRCKFNCKTNSTGIDPNSDWAKQKPLTHVELRGYLRVNYIYWGSDSNNIESYFHIIDGKYVMVPIKKEKFMYV